MFLAIIIASFFSHAVETEQHYFTGSLSLTGLTYTVDSSSLQVSGAVASASATSLTVSDCVFKDCIGRNSVKDYKVSGVALIMAADSTFTMNNVNFSSCTEAAIGAICGARTKVSLTKVLVSRTTTTHFPAVGLEFSGGSADVKLTGCYFHYNTNNDGGFFAGALGITLSGPHHKVIVDQCDFFFNKHTGRDGVGGISFDVNGANQTLTGTSCCFDSNTGSNASDLYVTGFTSGALITRDLVSTSVSPRVWPSSDEYRITEGSCKNGPEASAYLARPHFAFTMIVLLVGSLMMLV
jgi:hypothetical protein